ncbi:hypothetical protein BS50DRAFT_548006 [Corynespora cassiicola Philippines]|uniref:SET domain-containing protein n=1 Tax=Corynespora cassiicola Philippines TaxID=1448308 RepID=A0A2T2NXG3_CORCC|nr:hypothetical protein BS50DRAFT_548006 [Corynespora cassiicola Philippines]
MARAGDTLANSICLDSDSDEVVQPWKQHASVSQIPGSVSGPAAKPQGQPPQQTVFPQPNHLIVDLTGDEMDLTITNHAPGSLPESSRNEGTQNVHPAQIPFHNPSSAKETSGMFGPLSKSTTISRTTIANLPPKLRLTARKSAPTSPFGTERAATLLSSSRNVSSREGIYSSAITGPSRTKGDTDADASQIMAASGIAPTPALPVSIKESSPVECPGTSIETSRPTTLPTSTSSFGISSESSAILEHQPVTEPAAAPAVAAVARPSAMASRPGRSIKSAPSTASIIAPAFRRPNHSGPALRQVFEAPSQDISASPRAASTARQDLGLAIQKVVTENSQHNKESSIQIKPPISPEKAPSTEAPHRESLAIPDVRLQLEMAVTNGELENAWSVVENAFQKHWDKLHNTYRYIVHSVMRRERSCYAREDAQKALRLRKQQNPPIATSRTPIQETSPFSEMHPIQKLVTDSDSIPGSVLISQEVLDGRRKNDAVRSCFQIPVTSYRSDAVKIPPFKEYLSVKRSILVENQTKLWYYPYLQDDDLQARHFLYKDLPAVYHMKNELQPFHNLHTEQSRFYRSLALGLLQELGLGLEHILCWFLAPQDEIKSGNASLTGSNAFEPYVLNRALHLHDNYREEELWKGFLATMDPLPVTKVRMAAIACLVFLEGCDFSLWHLARRCDAAQAYILSVTQVSRPVHGFSYRSKACRVCHEHDCLFHGEYRDGPGNDSDDDPEVLIPQKEPVEEPTKPPGGKPRKKSGKQSRKQPRKMSEKEVEKEAQKAAEKEPERESAKEAEETVLESHIPSVLDFDPGHEARESDVEQAINYRRHVNADAVPENSKDIKQGRDLPKAGADFDVAWAAANLDNLNWEKRKPFYPCKHEGTSCDQAKCRCFRENICCEKTCLCADTCNRRFPGCKCSPGGNLCATNAISCICRRLNRECDADLCGACGAPEVLDPANRHDEHIGERKCRNVAIQRNVPKKTMIGTSEVHGFGLYIGQDVKKNDYLGEYKGEIVTRRESERRGKIYEYEKTEYLFNQSRGQEVDATYVGNKTRFINNADKKFSNCTPKILLCNTVLRTGLFASKNLKAGTELFFDYYYPEEKQKDFQQPKRPAVVAVKKKMSASADSASSYKTASSNPSLEHSTRGSTRLTTQSQQAQPARVKTSLSAKHPPQNMAKKAAPSYFVSRKSVARPDEFEDKDGENDEDEDEYEYEYEVDDDEDGDEPFNPSQTKEEGEGSVSEPVSEGEKEFAANGDDDNEEEDDDDEYEETVTGDIWDVPVTDNETRRSEDLLPARRTRQSALARRSNWSRKRKRIIEDDEDE